MSRSPHSRRRLRAPRMTLWTIIALCLLLALAEIRPEQLQVVLYKAGLVTLAAVIGYWIDRSLFPYARPDCFQADEDNAEEVPAPGSPECGTDDVCVLGVVSEANPRLMAAAMLRRAIIVAAAMLAMGLGA